MRRISLLAALLLLAAACSGAGRDIRTETRFPDDEGIVADVNFARIVLDERRSYKISAEVASFSTHNGAVIPVLSWKGKYVHVGLDGKTAVWIAGIGLPDRSVGPPVVHYTNGLFLRVDSRRRAIFADGTVLKLARGVNTPPPKTTVTARIDPAKHLVIEMVWEAP